MQSKTDTGIDVPKSNLPTQIWLIIGFMATKKRTEFHPREARFKLSCVAEPTRLGHSRVFLRITEVINTAPSSLQADKDACCAGVCNCHKLVGAQGGLQLYVLMCQGLSLWGVEEHRREGECKKYQGVTRRVPHQNLNGDFRQYLATDPKRSTYSDMRAKSGEGLESGERENTYRMYRHVCRSQ